MTGVGRHRLRGEPVCEECRLAENERNRKRYKPKPPRRRHPSDPNPWGYRKRLEPMPYGQACKARPVATGAAGVRRHQRAGEPVCEECKEERRDEQRRRYTPNPYGFRMRLEPMPYGQACMAEPARPGTRYGYIRHLRRNEPPCLECRHAMNEMSKAKNQGRMQELLDRDGPGCFYCGKLDGAMHMDHVEALKNGGVDELWNIVIACQKCNTQKWAHNVVDWLRQRDERGEPMTPQARALAGI